MRGKSAIALVLLCVWQSSSSGTLAQVTNPGVKKTSQPLSHVEQKWSSLPNLPANLKHDITAANQDWIDGLKAGNADLIVAAYAEDSVFCSAGGDCIKGPAAVAAQYRESILKSGRATDAFVRSDSLYIDHDLAYESGYAEAHLTNGAARKGRFCTVWKRGPNGHWKIFRNLSLPAAGS